jgi:hypothetical protein
MATQSAFAEGMHHSHGPQAGRARHFVAAIVNIGVNASADMKPR